MTLLPVEPAYRLAGRSEEHRWLVTGLWSEQAVGIVGGEPKCCKSWPWTLPSRSPPASHVCAASPCGVPVASCCSPPRTHCTSCADAHKGRYHA
jgi:hypothetical protein